MIRRLLVPVLLLASVASRAEIVQRSHTIFFPAELGTKVSAYQSFPVFWWNFYVVEGRDESESFRLARAACARLRQLPTDLLWRVECGQELSDFRQVVMDWVHDLPLRANRPSDAQLKNKFAEGLAKASIMSSDRTLLEFLRGDPLEAWRELKDIAQSKLHFPIERKEGFFFDADTRRIVIPLQLAFPPTEVARTRQLVNEMHELGGHFIGAHSSTLQNESQISEDLNTVSWVGIPILAMLALYLLVRGRWQFFTLIPVVFVATGLAALCTYLIYGSIHGLTLSFGSAVVGLALDYGLHGSLNHRAKNIWQSNLWGYFTTMLALLVLLFSEVPLMRQLMVFSSLGLTIAYIFYYVLIRKYPRFFAMTAFRDPPFRDRKQSLVVVFLIACCATGAVLVEPKLSMAQFDFQVPQTREIQTWLFKKLDMRVPLFRILERNEVFAAAQAEKSFSESSGIKVENVGVYLPGPEIQNQNLQSWEKVPCQKFLSSLPASEATFYRPFNEDVLCRSQSPVTIENASQRSYLKHLHSDHHWTSVWFPQDLKDEQAVKERFPDSVSFSELIALFPRMLSRELYWMIPLVLVLTALLLSFYYRKASLVGLALIPFFSGAGMIFFALYIFKLNFSFISLVGLVMVYGFSLDYGIFSTDQYHHGSSEEEGDGVWSTLRLSSLTTIASFVPFLFCKHPVLMHLGTSLFFGAIGTYIGAIWGVRSLGERKKIKTSLREAT